MVELQAVQVRHAGPGDAGVMRRLVEAAYDKYVARIGREPVPMTADYDEIAGSGRAWLAEEGNRIVGLLVLEAAEDHLLVENLAVAPEHQGRGLGSRLLQFAEGQARARGLHDVRLFTHVTMTENQAYYPRRGYTRTHRDGEDDPERVFFAKHLDHQA